MRRPGKDRQPSHQDDSMLEWKVEDDERITGQAQKPERRRRFPRLVWLPRVLGVLFILAVVSAVIVWRVAVTRQDRLLTDAQAAVDSELAAMLNGEPSLSVWDDNADRFWQTRYVNFIRSWVRQGKPDQATSRVLSIDLVASDLALAMVETKVVRSGVERASRQARVYRIDGRRWLRTSIDERAWGPQETYDTRRFHFVYHQRDASLAREISQGLDSYLERAYADLGLGLPPTNRITVALDIANPFTDASRTDEGYRLASPLVTMNGVDTAETPAQVARWHLASTLINTIVLGSIYESPATWKSLVSAMIGAEANTFAPFPVAWRRTTYERLRQAIRENSLIPLSELEKAQKDQLLISVLYSSLGEFTVSRYGPTGPGRVLAATRKAQTWDDISRDGYGMNAPILEGVWQEWLKKKVERQE